MTTTTQALDFNWDRFGGTFLDAIGDTLLMVIVTMLVGGFFGLVIGVLLYSTRDQGVLRNKFVYTVLNILVNFIRPIPFIILIAAIGPLTLKVIGTTVGTNAVMFVMSIAATFGVARIVEQNLVSIDPGVVEAARAMGASPLKIITSVIIPEALGPLILGYTFLFIAVVDMSAMAGIIGGGGLGDFAITYGYQSFNWSVTLVATAAIIVIVQIAQLLGNWLSRKVMRR
ncbi:methionine ABC transporter permease [Corynebacterium pygosceleis]|uniref:ABC transporter permease n=1 Tax=Corynebacterium pygosceleis TaxID=2800406 RepID=A0A9Q4C9F6_9CORY|nr:methionine ABC transporter permease [Corynebacterium pygosceleis]MCK7637603.1 ABC transporter permease [Corynebacterium pygosceleis]MCK7674794.1 ABC transporter permease [Corynebacterium pygosceleis]MCL0119617.1 ABC transporter permease [Corynebacterium pygosceleis]MCX7444858.1 ABC transporter permease [Corynebacterium pygosceleis]MCX7468068.1 ABC transporter permease [Corynebacterium pygosceleis]